MLLLGNRSCYLLMTWGGAHKSYSMVLMLISSIKSRAKIVHLL
jgi:hypothetical protein